MRSWPDWQSLQELDSSHCPPLLDESVAAAAEMILVRRPSSASAAFDPTRERAGSRSRVCDCGDLRTGKLERSRFAARASPGASHGTAGAAIDCAASGTP